jgi:contact-dependent growth inhibition (CDI) system CdiI-like immunity protein
MFDLYFSEGPTADDDGWWHAVGTIVLGEDRDGFAVSLEWWGRAAYEQQWLAAAKRLVNGAERVMFLGSYNGPEAAFHFAWPAWRDGDLVHVQNWLVLTEQLPTPFEPDEADRFVRRRQTISEDGEPISEWDVSLADVQAFLERRSAPLFPA